MRSRVQSFVLVFVVLALAGCGRHVGISSPQIVISTGRALQIAASTHAAVTGFLADEIEEICKIPGDKCETLKTQVRPIKSKLDVVEEAILRADRVHEAYAKTQSGGVESILSLLGEVASQLGVIRELIEVVLGTLGIEMPLLIQDRIQELGEMTHAN